MKERRSVQEWRIAEVGRSIHGELEGIYWFRARIKTISESLTSVLSVTAGVGTSSRQTYTQACARHSCAATQKQPCCIATPEYWAWCQLGSKVSCCFVSEPLSASIFSAADNIKGKLKVYSSFWLKPVSYCWPTSLTMKTLQVSERQPLEHLCIHWFVLAHHATEK